MDSYRERNYRQSGTLNAGDDSKFIPSRRYVPRWRKFQFRNRRSKTSEGLGMYSSTPSDLNLMSDFYQPTPEPRFTMTDGDEGRMRVQGGESAYFRSANTHVATRHSQLSSRIRSARRSSQHDVSPTRSSSDELSEEYKPLPSELREPRKLAESSPSKRSQVSDQNAMEEGVQGAFRERNAGTAVQGGITKLISLNSQARKNNSPDHGDLSKRDQPHISPDRADASPTNVSGEHPTIPREYRLTSAQTKPSASPSRVTPSVSLQQTMQTLPMRETRTVSPQALNSQTDNGMSHPSGLSRGDSGGSGGIVQSAPDYILSGSGGIVQSAPDYILSGSGGIVQSAPDYILSGSGGIEQSTPADYIDALAERVIREGDSGVTLNTNLDPKNGLSTNLYQHKLLSLDEQTYANSLIEKYMVKMV